MKKTLLLILGLMLIASMAYGASQLKPKPDETKAQGESEKMIQASSNPNDDLTVPELEDFDQEVQSLDESINQL